MFSLKIYLVTVESSNSLMKFSMIKNTVKVNRMPNKSPIRILKNVNKKNANLDPADKMSCVFIDNIDYLLYV